MVYFKHCIAQSPDKPPEESVALEKPLGVLLLEGEQLTGSRPDQGEAVLDPPHLSRRNENCKPVEVKAYQD